MDLLSIEADKIQLKNAQRVLETLFKMYLPDFLSALNTTNYVTNEIYTAS
jgi:hypothetical protein